MTSSVIPSANIEPDASVLMLWNGSTATDASRSAAATGATSASANSPHEANRSAGAGDNARRIASSTAAGTVGRTRRTDGTSPEKRLAMMACAVGPVNGGSPASSS